MIQILFEGYDDEDDKPKPVVVQNEMDKVAKRDVVQGVKLAPSKFEGGRKPAAITASS